MRTFSAFPFSLVLVIGLALFSALKRNVLEDPTVRLQAVSGIASYALFNPAAWPEINGDPRAVSTIVFADDFETDPQGRWQVQVQGSASGPTGFSQSVRYEASEGNPGGFRAMTHAIDGEGNLIVTHVYTAQYYVPSEQGAVTSLYYREDRRSLTGQAVGSRVVVWQGGQVHVALLTTFQDEAWTTETALSLTAADFTPVPDFSATGDTLWFGYERANTNTSANAVQQREHGIDNWEVGVASAPLPGVLCTLEPQNAIKVKGQEHTVTVTVTADGTPVVGQTVTFDVISGPNDHPRNSDSGTTDANGQASYTYTSNPGDGGGTDIISAQGNGFSCTAQITWMNTAPVANDDWFVLFADSIRSLYDNSPGFYLEVLDNDFDPNGDEIIVSGFTQPAQTGSGTVASDPFADLSYRPDTRTSDVFTYTISDTPDGASSDAAEVTVLIDCGCTTECITGDFGKTRPAGSEAIDLTLLRRVRDELFRPTEHGARYVDIYYETTPEIALLLILEQPALGMQAVRMVEALQPALRDMLEGDGSALITQAQMDSLAIFFADLSTAGSDSLQALINEELTRVGPLDDYVGLPVRDVLTTVLGEPVGTPIEHETQPAPTDFVLHQNFPNPFERATEIRYVLSRPTPVSVVIYNVRGQKVRTLVYESQMPGVHSVIWKGLNDGGVAVSSGVYLFRLQTPTYQATKAMVLRK